MRRPVIFLAWPHAVAAAHHRATSTGVRQTVRAVGRAWRVAEVEDLRAFREFTR